MDISTTRDVAPGRRIVVLPLGAFEQHGPHLPLHTDSLIIETVVEAALTHPGIDRDRFLVAPTIAITASDEHAGFAGSLSCGTDALVDAVVAICRSASWARGVCIVNGHGGNFDALRRIESALQWEKIVHSVWSLPAYDGGDMHAGRTETSVLLHIAPHLVHLERVEPGAVDLTSSDMASMRTGGVRAVSSNGILGDPARATSDHGREVLEMYRDALVATLTSAASTWPDVDADEASHESTPER